MFTPPSGLNIIWLIKFDNRKLKYLQGKKSPATTFAPRSLGRSQRDFELYSDMGNREDKNKNRLYFLIKELGIDGFRKRNLSRRLVRDAE
jgi:hypothetical protein